MSERQGTRNGPEARPGVWQWRRIWTSQVIITQWAEIPRQETGAKHDQALAAHGRLGVWQGWSSREARIIHRRAGVHNGQGFGAPGANWAGRRNPKTAAVGLGPSIWIGVMDARVRKLSELVDCEIIVKSL